MQNHMYRQNDVLTWSNNVYIIPDLSDVRFDSDWTFYYKQRSVRHDHYAHKADLDKCIAIYPIDTPPPQPTLIQRIWKGLTRNG